MTDAKNWNLPQFCLAMAALLGLLALQIIESFYGKVVDAGVKQIIIGFATLAYAFFFQTSAGSRAKDQLIAKQAETVATATAAAAPAAAAGTPSGTPGDPVSVTVEAPDPALDKLRAIVPAADQAALEAALKVLRKSRPVDIPT